MDYESSTHLGDGEEKGVRSSGGIASSKDAEARTTANDSAVDTRKREKLDREALQELANTFAEKFGFDVIITPDSAGRVIYGDNKFTLELRIPPPEEGEAAADTEPESFPFRGYLQSVAGVPKVRIQNGDVNSVVPPEVQGGSGPVDFDTDDYVYYVEAEVDEDGIFTGTVSIGRGASVPDDTDSVVHRRLFEVQDGEVLQSVQNSLEFAMCAGVVSWGSV